MIISRSRDEHKQMFETTIWTIAWQFLVTFLGWWKRDPLQGLLVTSNDRGSKGAGLNHLVFSQGGLLEFFVLVIFSPSSHIHQSQTEEGVEDGGALSHTFLAKKRRKSTYSCFWWFRNPVVTGWYGKFQYYVQGFVHPCSPMFGFQGLLKVNLQGFNNPRTWTNILWKGTISKEKHLVFQPFFSRGYLTYMLHGTGIPFTIHMSHSCIGT